MTTLINNELIQQAAQQAAQQGRRAIELLEELSGLDANAFTEQLAKSHHYTLIQLTEMMQLAPAFEHISFSESLQRECVLLSDEGDLVFVFADTFNTKFFF